MAVRRPIVKQHANGHQASAWTEIDTREADNTDPDNPVAGIEVDDDHMGSPVEKVRLDLRGYTSLELYWWVEDETLDIEIRRVEGYSADGGEVLGEFLASAPYTAAADPNDVQEAEITQAHSDTIRGGIYVILANRAGDTDPGRLHLLGWAKAG